MNRILTFLLFSFILITAVHGQTTPVISFVYDADGNMTAQYVIVMKNAELNSEDDTEEDEFFKVEEGNRQITVFPNPTKGRIVVSITPLPANQRSYMQLYDIKGMLLQRVEIVSEQTPVEISGATGVYLLHIYTGDEVSQWKIIKE